MHQITTTGCGVYVGLRQNPPLSPESKQPLLEVGRGGQLLSWSCMGWLLLSSLVAAQTPIKLDEAAMMAELQRLDGICEKLGLEAERQLMGNWLVDRATDAHLYYLPLPEDPLASQTSAEQAKAVGNSEQHAHWLKHFSKARAAHAQYWYERAQQHAESGDEWQAYLALWRAAREDSTQAETRRVLAPLLNSLAIKGRPRTVTTSHAKFRWPGGSYQRLETANFKITSRCDPKTALAIAQQLENFYAVWTQVFYPLWAPPGQTRNRLAGRNPAWTRPVAIDVVICQDRDDYLKTLGMSEANIGVSVGYYSPDARISFFYPDANLQATLYHELTHQLLAEASQLKQAAAAGREDGFWLVEAAALYMESLLETDTHWRLGGWLAPRLQAARYRALREGFWVPPDKLQALNLTSWKDEPEIARLYTHAAGLAHFFLDRRLPAAESEQQFLGNEPAGRSGYEQLEGFDAEAARAAFYRGLVACYSGQASGSELWEFMGADPQRAYVHFLLVRDRHLRALAPQGVVRTSQELVLVRSQLSSDAWQRLSGFENLQWLDLSFTNLAAPELDWLGNATKLERLSLEGLQLRAETLGLLNQLVNLNELDLSSCGVDDLALTSLGKFKSLEVLWLSENPITAECSDWIKSQPSLNQVMLDGTQFTTPQAEDLNSYLRKRAVKPQR